jgi:cytoskeletal protein RodZ
LTGIRLHRKLLVCCGLAATITVMAAVAISGTGPAREAARPDQAAVLVTSDHARPHVARSPLSATSTPVRAATRATTAPTTTAATTTTPPATVPPATVPASSDPTTTTPAVTADPVAAPPVAPAEPTTTAAAATSAACTVALAYLAANAAPGFATFCRPGTLVTAAGPSAGYTCVPGSSFTCPDGVAEIIISDPTCAASYENEASNSHWDFSGGTTIAPGAVQDGRTWDPYGACVAG